MLTRCGDDLFTISVASPADAQALAAHLRRSGHWLEIIPGIDSVVVRFDALQTPAEEVRTALESTLEKGVEPLYFGNEIIEIPVFYGGDEGPDLDALCATTGLTAGEVIELHTSREYTVDMIGFTPGFAFVGGLDDRLRVPRRKEPRQRVESGSVGIADGRTGLYAMASPGGWSIIGRTPLQLFVPGADEPFVLRAGMRVRFRAVEADEL